MKNIFLSIALAIAVHASAQNPAQSRRPVNRASELNYELSMTTKADSLKLSKKTIVQELALPKALDILIAMSGNLVINTWNENKIKLETTFQFQEPNELTDEQWLERLGISMKVFGSTVKVKTSTNSGIMYIGNNGAITYTSGTGTKSLISSSPYFYNNNHFTNQQNEPVTLYIPAESILEIESKYGRLKINNNIKSLLLDNTDGEMEFANIGRLQLRSTRGSFNGASVDEADVEISHARFALKAINKGTVTSNYSTIEIETLKDVKLSSSNDEIDVDNAGALYGIKNYGNLRINQLTGKLEIQGFNSDIKLRRVNPSVQLVKIVNRNADLRLPSGDLSNFSVDVRGSYNKIYSSFTETIAVDTLTLAETEAVNSLTNAMIAAGPGVNVTSSNSLVNQNALLQQKALSHQQNALAASRYDAYQTRRTASSIEVIGREVQQNPFLKYSAKVGSGNDQLKYQIICTNCVIDFK